MSWLGSDQSVFLVMVAAAVFLLAQSFVVPTFGENRQARKRLRARLQTITANPASERAKSLLRQKHLRDLAPWERWLEALPGMAPIQSLAEQAGVHTPAYRVLLASLALAVMGAYALTFFVDAGSGIPLMVGGMLGFLPFLRLRAKRVKRLAAFEEQLPEALTVAARALRAGHPFSESLRLVSEEMADPVATEFGMVFNQINYGGDVRDALTSLLERIPSITVMALVSSLLVQRESGGNLSELLDKLAKVVRQRFRFQRQLKTLSAPGRMAAWVLSLLPFFLGSVLAFIAPDFLVLLTKNPTGRDLIVAAFGLMVVGIIWLSRIVRIDV